MPIRVAELTLVQKKIEFNVGKDRCWVIYRPHELTPAREALLQNMTNAQRNDDDDENAQIQSADEMPSLQLIKDLVLDWDVEGPMFARVDVTDDDGNIVVKEGDLIVEEGEKVLPIPDHTLHLSLRLIGLVMKAIREDLSDDPKSSANNSRGGSFRRAK